MSNFLKGLILIPLGLVIIVVAIANRGPVTLLFDPFSREQPAYALTLPLFVVILLAVMVGVVIGGVAVWLRQGAYRRRARAAEASLRRVRADAKAPGTELQTLPRVEL